MQRLKVPPSINQFAKALDKNAATELFKLLVAYQPETKAAKADRLKALAGIPYTYTESSWYDVAAARTGAALKVLDSEATRGYVCSCRLT